MRVHVSLNVMSKHKFQHLALLPSSFGWVTAATKEEWLKLEGDHDDVKKNCKEKGMFRDERVCSKIHALLGQVYGCT